MNRLVAIAVLLALGAVACKKEERSQATITASDGRTVEKASPDAGPAQLTRPFLWKAEKDGKAVYLLGTIHVGVDPARLPPIVWDKLDRARAFAMEIDLFSVDAMALLTRDDGKTLDQDLGPEYWKKLEALVGEKVAAGFKGMKASTVSQMLQLSMLPSTPAMELALIQRAKQAGARMVYLEEASLQTRLLDRWLDVRALKDMIDNHDEMKASSNELRAAYEAGDGDKMLPLSLDEEGWLESGRSKEEFEQMRKEMLLDRNASWIPAIEQLAAEGTDALVAVGVAHLLGEGSVLDLLAKRGFAITRLPEGTP